jgi:hypothetical protein
MFHPSRTLAVTVGFSRGNVKHKNTSLPQVMQGLRTLRIRAMTHHKNISTSALSDPSDSVSSAEQS